MGSKTYYEILEISTKASEEVIRSAYKSLAKKYHPDVYKGNMEDATLKMAEINVAYKVLSNPEMRRKYDETLVDERKNTFSSEEDDINFSTESTKETHFNNNPPDNNPQNSADSRKNSGCLGCLGSLISGVIGLLIGVLVIYFIILIFQYGFTGAVDHIKSLGNSNVSGASSSAVDLSNSSHTITNSDSDNFSIEEGWDVITLVNGDIFSLSAMFPNEFKETLYSEGNEATISYNTDNWSIYVYAYMNDDFEELEYDWTQEKIDSSYNGTAGEFMYEYLSEEIYRTKISGAYSSLNIVPTENIGEEVINNTTWITNSYSGETSADGGAILNVTVYFHIDNYTTTVILVNNSYFINGIENTERITMDKWLEKIEGSFEVSKKEKIYQDVSPDNKVGNYLYPSNSQYITEDELSQFTQEEIRLIRNEIYARHGCNFKDSSLREYFESQSWYEPIDGLYASDFDESLLNNYEKTNIRTISNYEQKTQLIAEQSTLDLPDYEVDDVVQLYEDLGYDINYDENRISIKYLDEILIQYDYIDEVWYAKIGWCVHFGYLGNDAISYDGITFYEMDSDGTVFRDAPYHLISDAFWVADSYEIITDEE